MVCKAQFWKDLYKGKSKNKISLNTASNIKNLICTLFLFLIWHKFSRRFISNGYLHAAHPQYLIKIMKKCKQLRLVYLQKIYDEFEK